jgi:hypothetical protein
MLADHIKNKGWDSGNYLFRLVFQGGATRNRVSHPPPHYIDTARPWHTESPFDDFLGGGMVTPEKG